MVFDPNDLDHLLTRGVTTGVYEGVAAIVVDRQGVLYEGSAGTASADTVFRNASMTKAVTATAALQLIEREHMALDQPVDFRVVLTNDLGYFAGGRPE